MLALDEYLSISRKVIKKHGSKRMLNDEDAIAYVANYLMQADHKYNGKFGNIEGFRALYGSYAIRNWINRHYKNQHTVSMPLDMEDGLVSSDCVVNNVMFNEIHDYIQTLPKRKRDVIKMYFYERKTLREIAQKLDITPEAVRLRIQVVIKELKEKFNA